MIFNEFEAQLHKVSMPICIRRTRCFRQRQFHKGLGGGFLVLSEVRRDFSWSCTLEDVQLPQSVNDCTRPLNIFIRVTSVRRCVCAPNSFDDD